jgi:trehalose 6-phosphate phosphatase
VPTELENLASLPELGADAAFFLDIDGTLVAIAERPDIVRIEPSLMELIRGVREAAGGAVAIVSGRTIRDIDRLFAPLVLPAAGQHGLERRDAEGRLHRHDFTAGPLREAALRLAAFASAHPGLLLEDKGASLALHYRQSPSLEGAVREAVGREAQRIGRNFEMQQGIKVIELKPSGRDKGMAIAEFLDEAPFKGRKPVFVGDDLTDEFGFAMVNRLGGCSIKVGPGETAAGWRIEHAAAVLVWLAGWARQFRLPG